MGSKPKQSDYKPSEAEQASAAVAQAEYDYFKQKYDPLLQEMRDKVTNEDVRSGLRGRANADVMQALSTPTYETVTRSDATGDLAGAVSGQLNAANVAATDVKNTMGASVLGTARGQAADAQTGMAQASRLATSNALERAKAKEMVAQAKAGAAAQIGSALIMNAAKNYMSAKPGDPRSALSKMMTPTDENGLLASSLGDRFRFAMGMAPGYTIPNYAANRATQQLSVSEPQMMSPGMPTFGAPSLGQFNSQFNPIYRPGR